MDAFIYDAVRTPRGRAGNEKRKGALSDVKAIDLLGGLYRSLADRTALRPDHVDDVILGCSTPRGELGSNIARISALYAGWGERASGTTVNRFCASGLEAIASAAARVASGMADVVIAGGIEMPSRVPMMSDGGAWFEDPEVAKKTGFIHMAVAADLLATTEGFGRAELDAYALRSHDRAARAWRDGVFARSVVPVKAADGTVLVLDRDECIREGSTLEKLAALPVLFPEGDRGDRVVAKRFPELGPVQHVHSVASSPAMADGASLVVVGSRAIGEKLGLVPRARIVAFADVATDPVVMLGGNPVAAERALRRAGIAPKDVARFEVNESFAAVPLHFARKLEIDAGRLNVHGGAIAMGHPLGATGGVLVATLLDELDRIDSKDARFGVVAICAAAGIASAMVIERIAP